MHSEYALPDRTAKGGGATKLFMHGIMFTMFI